MKRLLMCFLLCSLMAFAAEKAYVKGTLIDVTVGQRIYGRPTGNRGTVIRQGDVFRVSVKVDDIIFTGETETGNVRKLTIGDPVEVRVEDRGIYLRCPDGKEIKIKLLTKARASQE